MKKLGIIVITRKKKKVNVIIIKKNAFWCVLLFTYHLIFVFLSSLLFSFRNILFSSFKVGSKKKKVIFSYNKLMRRTDKQTDKQKVSKNKETTITNDALAIIKK